MIKKKPLQVLKLVLTILTPLFLVSQTSRKYSNEFMNIGVDASALGMSNAVVASTADVNSGYWNPAGLVHLDDNQIAFMHSSYFANIANYNYMAFAMPLDDLSAIGVSLIRFGVDDILETMEDQGLPTQLAIYIRKELEKTGNFDEELLNKSKLFLCYPR